MTFVCILEKDDCEVDILQRGNAWLTITNVGYDDVEDWRYSLIVGLEPMAGGDTEFYFRLVRAEGDDGAETDYWCGKDVAAFVEPDERKLILDAALTATVVLIRNARPERVQYTTYDPFPPAKALVKHHAIAMMFSQAGYKVTTCDPYHGRKLWWMERQADPEIDPG